MKKFFSVGFATLGSLLLILILVFTTLQIVINDETFVNNEFTKLELNEKMGMSNADLVSSMMRLVDYMEGRVPDIKVAVTVHGEPTDMFTLEQEVEHMKDVQLLYQRIRTYRDTGVLVMLMLFLLGALINFRQAPQTLTHGYLSGFFIALLFFGFIGTWATMDFTSFWTFFHQMLFWYDLWLFDTSESRMINMLPEQIFSDIVSRVFMFAGILVLLLLLLAVVAMIMSSSGYQRRHAEALKRRKAREQARLLKEQERIREQAEQERQKRIAKKKAKRAELEKRRAREAAAARKKAEKQRRRTASAEEPEDAEDMDYDGQEGESILLGAEDPAEDEPAAAPVVEGRQKPRREKRSHRSGVSDDTGFLDE